MSQEQTSRKIVRDYLFEHPEATNRQIVDALGVSVRTITNARSDLRERFGGKYRAYGDRKSEKSEVETPSPPREEAPPQTVNPSTAIEKATEGFDIQTTRDLNAEVEKELRRRMDEALDLELGEIDMEKLKKILWKVIHRNTDDRIVVAAATALARIKAETDARPLGPGAPLTRRDAKDRLKMIFMAAGINLVVEALNEWMADATSQATQPAEAASAPAEALGAPNNPA